MYFTTYCAVFKLIFILTLKYKKIRETNVSRIIYRLVQYPFSDSMRDSL